MPLIHVTTSRALSDPSRTQALLEALSGRLAEHLKKPEAYVMTCLTPGALMTFGGSAEPACYVEIKNIGTFTPALTVAMSRDLCTLLSLELSVDKNRIYIEFTNAEPHLWGFDGETFA
jgi:phenylpyruvate tautomerase